MTFVEFLADVKANAFPDGRSCRLANRHRAWVIDCLIDLQLTNWCLRQRHRQKVSFGDTMWSCGASAIELPEGKITEVRTQGTDDCVQLTVKLIPERELRCKIEAHTTCCESSEVPYDTYLDGDDETIYYPEDEDDFKYPTSNTNTTVAARYRWMAAYDNRLWIYPALNSDEIAIIYWKGIKKCWDDEDDIPWDVDGCVDRTVQAAAEEFLKSKSYMEEDADPQRASAAIAFYNKLRADLIHECRQKNMPESSTTCSTIS